MRYDPREVGGVLNNIGPGPGPGRWRWQDKDGDGGFATTIPANTSTTATISVPGTQTSQIDVIGDHDWFAVTLQAGVTYNFRLTSGTLSDPYLALYNGAGSLITVNDNSGPGFDSWITGYIPNATGTFYLGASGVAGSTGTYTLEALAVGGGGDDIDGAITTSSTLTINGASATSTVNNAGDEDWYRITLNAGESYAFTLNQTVAGAAGLDAFLRLYDSAGNWIAVDDDGGAGSNSLMRFTAVESGAYYLSAGGYDTDTGGYTISAATGPAQNPLDTLDLEFTFGTTNINVYFATSGQDIGPLSAAVRSWTASEIASVMSALQTIADTTNLTFTQVGTSAGAQFIMALTDLDDNVLGITYPNPSQAHLGFAPDAVGWTTAGLQPGGLGYSVIIHEIGHALGLDHPHMDGLDVQVMQGVIDNFNSYGTFEMNQGVFTIMSYNDGWPLGPDGLAPSYNYGFSGTPMALDIAFLQMLYGADPNRNSTNTTYTLSDTNSGAAYTAIWDTGGADTISYSGARNIVINLTAASLLSEIGGGGFVSYAAGIFGGFTIANGVVIENATGGAGADTLTGNSADNVLTGNGGNDTLRGEQGIDTSLVAATSDAASWTRNIDGTWTVAGEGTDQLSSIEMVQFNDRMVVLDIAQQTFSGNGTSDLLFRNTGHGTVVIWDVTGAVQNSATIAGGAPANWAIISTGDIDGDGRDDMLWRNSVDGGVAAWLMNGATATSTAMVGGAPAEWQVAGMGDFNFDGKDDFIWRNSNDGAVAVWLMDGLNGHSDAIISGAPLEWDIAAIADFDGDGSDDILLRHEDGALARWTTNGVTQTGAAIVGVAGNEWQIAGTGDFDGDARADILWRNSSDGGIALWRMNGDVPLAQSMVSAAPLQWSITQIGDFNADGKDDVLLRHDDGTIALWVMNGASITSQNIVAWVPTEWGII